MTQFDTILLVSNMFELVLNYDEILWNLGKTQTEFPDDKAIPWTASTSERSKIKILGAVLELPAKEYCQSSPFTAKMGQMGWIGSTVYLVHSSKMAPRILIGAKPLF